MFHFSTALPESKETLLKTKLLKLRLLGGTVQPELQHKIQSVLKLHQNRLKSTADGQSLRKRNWRGGKHRTTRINRLWTVVIQMLDERLAKRTSVVESVARIKMDELEGKVPMLSVEDFKKVVQSPESPHANGRSSSPQYISGLRR